MQLVVMIIGTLTIGAVTGGTAPYTYSSMDQGLPPPLFTITWLQATYNVIVRDANGCDYPTTATITNTGGPTAIVITPLMQPAVNANGSVTLGAVTGGVAPYTYSCRWLRDYFHHCLQ
jgi:hypothetical protein